jgi:P27 family predicted phage terminase small subunit
VKKGPSPRPTALKVLEGTRTDRVNLDEPKFADACLEPPGWLGARGREHWLELAPVLAEAGVLTAGDRPALAQLCDDFETILNSIDGPDPAEGEDPKTIRQVLRNADKARDRYRRMLCEFGLTPSSRSRIRTKPAEPDDRLAAFLEKRQ